MGHPEPVRRFSFNIGATFVPHYNHALGRYVSNLNEFDSEMRRASDKASTPERLWDGSIVEKPEHNYQRIDYHDKEALGVTDEGQDTWEERHNITNNTATFF